MRSKRLLNLGLGIVKSTTKYSVYYGLNQALILKDRALKAKDDLQHKINLAKDIVELLADTKGPLMKVGQMLALSDDIVLPPQVTEVFKKLQSQAKVTPFEEMEKTLIEEFGSDWRQKFLDFNEKAFAAASIGQVYQATTLQKQLVAIKVQYPFIAAEIENDLKKVDQLRFAIETLARNNINSQSLAEEFKEQMRFECDYEREAKWQELFKVNRPESYHSIYIPAVYQQLSRSRILTTEFIQGTSINAIKNMPLEKKEVLAQQFYDYFMFCLLEQNVIHADPQMGNFIFTNDEKIAYLDFGSCRSFDTQFLKDYVGMLAAVEETNSESFIHHASALEICDINDSEKHLKEIFLLIQKLYLPFITEEKTKVPDYNPFMLIKSFVENLKKVKKKTPKKEFLLLDRTLFGIYSFIKMWDVAINWRSSFFQYRQKYLEDLS